jgi:hypothetical protein
MKLILNLNKFASLLSVAMCLHHVALGDTITVLNPSFEGLTGTDPTHFDTAGNLLPGHAAILPSKATNPSVEYATDTPVPGWQVSGGAAGTLNYTGTQYLTGGVPDGQNAAFANGFQNQHGVLSQTLGEQYQVGMTYELKVDVSSINGFPVGTYSISLGAGGTVVAGASDLVPGPTGSFSTVTVTASIDGNSSAVGQPITISLANSGVPQSGTQVLFDNVRLTSSVTAVPEPSTWALFAIGVFGLFAAGRGRRNP